MYSLLIIYLILLAIYIYVESQNKFNLATFLKVIVSFTAALTSWIATIKTGMNIFSVLISIGLSFAVIADYYLQFIKSNAKKYDLGIIAFSAMHLCLIISFFVKYQIHYLDFILLAIVVGVLVLFQIKEKWNLGKQKKLLSLYSGFVALMSAKAMSVCLLNASVHTTLIGLGGLSFIVSDILLGIWDYYDHREKYVLWNRLIYFIGQILFALSLWFIG